MKLLHFDPPPRVTDRDCDKSAPVKCARAALVVAALYDGLVPRDQGSAVVILLPFLDLMGFDATSKDNTPQTIAILEFSFALLPIPPIAGAAYRMWGAPWRQASGGTARGSMPLKAIDRTANPASLRGAPTWNASRGDDFLDLHRHLSAQ